MSLFSLLVDVCFSLLVDVLDNDCFFVGCELVVEIQLGVSWLDAGGVHEDADRARLVRLIRRVASVRMHVMSGCCVAYWSESNRDGVVYGVRGRLIGAAAWSPLARLRLPSMLTPVHGPAAAHAWLLIAHVPARMQGLRT